MLPGWQQAVPLQRTRPLKLIFKQQEMMLLSNIWLKWRVVSSNTWKQAWMAWLVCLKKITVFFLLLRNNGAATGIWPLITLTVNLIVDHTLTGEREMPRRSQCVVTLNFTKFSVCLSLELLLLCAVEPQYTHLVQSSKIVFARTYFYLQKAWSSHFLYRNFSWVVQDPVLGESCISIVQLSRNMK